MRKILAVISIIIVLVITGILFAENSENVFAQKEANIEKNIPSLNNILSVDREDVGEYVQKSTSEYSHNEKDTALKTIEEGLKLTPDNELLKSKRDILLKDFLADPNQDMPRE